MKIFGSFIAGSIRFLKTDRPMFAETRGDFVIRNSRLSNQLAANFVCYYSTTHEAKPSEIKVRDPN